MLQLGHVCVYESVKVSVEVSVWILMIKDK